MAKAKTATTKKTSAPVKAAATKKATKPAAAPKKQNENMYVVTVHTHYDDYKRADSSSETLGVFTSLKDAQYSAIRVLLSKNEYSEKMTSETLTNLIPALEGGGDSKNHSKPLLKDVPIKNVLTKISKFDEDSINQILQELKESLSEEEGQYTMRPSQTTATVSKVSFVKKMDTSEYKSSVY